MSSKKLKSFVTYNKGKVIATGFHNEKPVHKETTDASQSSYKQQIYGANESCIIDTGSDVNLLGRKHLKVFDKAGISYTVKYAATPFTIKGAFGTATATAKKIVTLSALRLNTTEGPVEFKNIQLYLLEKADEFFLGLPFTDIVGFNISSHLAEHKANLDGLNFDLNDGVQGVSSVWQMHFANGTGDYVPIQIDPRAPLDDADPLEEEAACLNLGQVDPKEEKALILAMKIGPMMQSIVIWLTLSTELRSLLTLRHR